jgi:hypothetical protein
MPLVSMFEYFRAVTEHTRNQISLCSRKIAQRYSLQLELHIRWTFISFVCFDLWTDHGENGVLSHPQMRQTFEKFMLE